MDLQKPHVASKTMKRAVLMLLCILLGLTIATMARVPHNADAAGYAATARAMKHGTNYYTARIKASARTVSQTRSVRPPTTSELLRRVPERDWLFLEGLLWAAALWIVTSISARPFITIIAAGAWLCLASRYGFALFSEIYGLPFAMYGLKQAREKNDARAALAFGAACLFRELYVIGLLVGILLRRRWAWATMLAAVACLYVAHALLVAPHLAARGTEEGFGSIGYTFLNIATVLGPWPGFNFFAQSAAILLLGLGLYRLARAREPFVICYVVIGVLVAGWSLRFYWQIIYILPLIAGLIGLTNANDPRGVPGGRLAAVR